MKKVQEISVRKVSRESGEWRTRFEAFYSDCEIKRVDKFPHAYFAAYSGDEIAGHSVVYFEGDRWIMDGLRVKPEFRERGIGKLLTEARLRHAAEQGAKEVWYACDDGNLVTICCHLRYGFEKICPHEHCNAATAHWYRLKISPALFKKFPSIKPGRAAGYSKP
jgi:GNAT superfamily N-acetyltransferase